MVFIWMRVVMVEIGDVVGNICNIELIGFVD